MATYINPMKDLGPALANIASGVAQVANPFHNLQLAVRDRIATDPALAQQLADLEDSSPGTLATLGLGKVGAEIAKIPPTTAQIIRRNIRPALENIGQNQDIQNTAATKVTTGETPGELSVEDFKAALANAGKTALGSPGVASTAGLEQATGMNPAQFAEMQVSKGNVDQAVDFIKQHPDVGPDKIVAAMISGKLPLSSASALFQGPTGAPIKQMFDLQMHLMDIDAMNKWRLSARSVDRGEAMERLKTARAWATYSAAGSVGSPDVMKDLLYDPATRQHAQDLLMNPASATSPEDKELLTTAQGLHNLSAAQRSFQLKNVTTQLLTLTSQLQDDITKGKVKEDAIGPQLDGIQQVLNARAAYGGQQFEIHYGKPPSATRIFGHAFGNNAIYYTTGDGKTPVDPSVVQSLTTSMTPEMQSKIARDVSTYQQFVQRYGPDGARKAVDQIADPEERRLVQNAITPSMNPAIPADTTQ